MILRTLTLSLLVASSATTQSEPFSLVTKQPVFQSGAILTWHIFGEPGQAGGLLFDLTPGPTTIPNLGTFDIGFSPAFGAINFVMPPEGLITFCDPAPCPPPGVPEVAVYLQAVSIDAPTMSLQISNGLALRSRDEADYCQDPVCVASSSIDSNFNGTAIDEGDTIWFNSIVKLQGLGDEPATVRFENVVVTLDVDGVLTTVPAPDATIIVSDLVETPETMFFGGEWITAVPLGHSGNIFLSGVPSTAPAGGLPGGISPVTWSGDFSSSTPNVAFQWKWAAAVYTMFGSEGELDVSPTDAGLHAGTPRNFMEYMTGGARGGGGSNFTGSYSGTETTQCQ